MDVIARVVALLERLPGVGPRTAARYAYYLLSGPKERTAELAQALAELAAQIRHCQRCFTFSQEKLCQICAGVHRDESTLCVVAKPQDIESVEKSGQFQGLYFVLGGLLNPLYGVEPETLRFDDLLARIKESKVPVKELILAINPTLEGENTIRHLKGLVKPLGLRVTVPARGLPQGADLEYADEITLAAALKGRREI